MNNNVNVILPKDGAILSVPGDTSNEALQKLAEQLNSIWPDRKFLMVAGDVKSVSEAEMNQAGWFKRDDK
ncbi:hypothetical protein [Idiomarina sp.]|uniref:hypothetical protein n=1 Tax=Idiomarina sp. TaxID=1874361 RepID=UPI003A8F72D4